MSRRHLLVIVILIVLAGGTFAVLRNIIFQPAGPQPPTESDDPNAPLPPPGTPIDPATLNALDKAGFRLSEPGSTSTGSPPTLRGAEVGDSDLTKLAEVRVLFALDLSNNRRLTDAGLVHLAGLTRLTSLVLSGPRVTDAGLTHLAGLVNLTTLSLSETKVSDEGLKHLSGLKTLTTLGLSDTRVTDAGLVHLAGLTNLTTLYLVNTKVTGAGLEHLTGLKNLTSLALERDQVTDGVLGALAGAGLLHALDPHDRGAGGKRPASRGEVVSLDLQRTGVTDAGLKHLAGLTNLTALHLVGTKVTDAGVKELQQALPGCSIYR